MGTPRKHFSKIFQTASIVLLLVSITNGTLAQSYGTSYELIGSDGAHHYRINVVVPDSLLQYYQDKSHELFSENDFAKFVTPDALKPISDSLTQIYVDDEDFVNGALTIVHQIPYEVTVPSKYPVETIVDNKGDCDLFSFIAASIIKARGMNVVLLYYENDSHMNVGVALSQSPRDARSSTYLITYQGIEYYVAECTGDNWQDGWRLGECPEELRNVTAKVLTLENCEQTAAGQVTASYRTLEAASLSLDVSSTFMLQGTALTVSGQLTPPQGNVSVTLYVRADGSQWRVLDGVATDSDGSFRYSWLTHTAGISYVRASWSGNEAYGAADSPTRTVMSLPVFVVALVAATVVFVAMALVVRLLGRRSDQAMFEPEPPQVP